MSLPNPPTPKPNAQPQPQKAAEHIVEAHRLLTALQKLENRPELEAAIQKLELALSALTLQTGGLL